MTNQAKKIFINFGLIVFLTLSPLGFFLVVKVVYRLVTGSWPR